MPRIKKNTLIKGASGNWQGELVYKQRGGQTFIAGMPTVDPNREATERQEEVMDTFASASAYAAEAILDPQLKAYYESKISESNTAFNVAFRDFAKLPKISEIKTDLYTGIAGSEIAVTAKKIGTKVTGVTVRIFSAAGALLEEGPAVVDNRRRRRWYYATTQANPALPGSKITAIATDLPGNEVTLEKTL
jgi:hypothetical protein